MTECKSCNKEHFIPSDSGLCLLCDMKAKKKSDIKAFIEKNVPKVESSKIPLEPIEPVITIDDF